MANREVPEQDPIGHGLRTIVEERLQPQLLTAILGVAAWVIVCTSLSLSASRPIPTIAAADHDAYRRSVMAEAQYMREELLWLARCIYSETKRPEEQELVAWVVRNRVETRYRGKDTYQKVVLDPWQFSAFHPSNPKRQRLVNLDLNSSARGFQSAVRIAARVMMASPEERPFSLRTRHFYSARSMQDLPAPAWAVDAQPATLDRHVDPERFRFYADVV